MAILPQYITKLYKMYIKFHTGEIYYSKCITYIGDSYISFMYINENKFLTKMNVHIEQIRTISKDNPKSNII